MLWQGMLSQPDPAALHKHPELVTPRGIAQPSTAEQEQTREQNFTREEDVNTRPLSQQVLEGTFRHPSPRCPLLPGRSPSTEPPGPGPAGGGSAPCRRRVRTKGAWRGSAAPQRLLGELRRAPGAGHGRGSSAAGPGAPRPPAPRPWRRTLTRKLNRRLPAPGLGPAVRAGPGLRSRGCPALAPPPLPVAPGGAGAEAAQPQVICPQFRAEAAASGTAQQGRTRLAGGAEAARGLAGGGGGAGGARPQAGRRQGRGRSRQGRSGNREGRG